MCGHANSGGGAFVQCCNVLALRIVEVARIPIIALLSGRVDPFGWRDREKELDEYTDERKR